MSSKLKGALVVACLLAGPAVAQNAAAPAGAAPAGTAGSTISGGLPEKTGSTTSVGQTKPPGGAVGDDRGTRPDLEAKSKQIDRQIDKGICSGCK